MVKWQEQIPDMRAELKPLGIVYASEVETRRREKNAWNKGRGKMPTKKGEGKAKSRRK